MKASSGRSYIAIASAIVIAGVLISASLFVAIGGAKITTVTKTITTTSTPSCAEGGSNATNAFATDCQLGITLGLATNPYVLAGNNQSFHVSIKNDLPTPNHANFTGFPPLPNILNPSLTSLYSEPALPQCSSLGFPIGYIVVYNESGYPLALQNPIIGTLTALCTALPGLQNSTMDAYQTVTGSFSIGGYWSIPNINQFLVNDSYRLFGPARYTVVAFDAWGQLAELNFTVLSNSFTYLSASSICTGPGGYAPCWGGDAYVFNCASAAATQKGCIQQVVTTILTEVSPPPSYVINIRYPFANQTEPSWANCLWTEQGITPGQGYANCMLVNSTSFIMGIQAPPHL